MPKIPFLLTSLLLFMSYNVFCQNAPTKYVLVIHGGAGTIERRNMSPEREKQYMEALTKALQTGYDVLKQHGSALDAVEKTIHVLEDNPLFNA